MMKELQEVVTRIRQTAAVSKLISEFLESTADYMGTKLVLFQKTFPGFGANISGGNGGSVVTVTTLDDNDSSPPSGSLREAINNLDGSPTIIKFAVSGRITLSAQLSITNKENVTIDGEGKIELTKYRLYIEGCDNVIIRNLRHRLGREVYDATGARSDCIEVFRNAQQTPSSRVAIDHCSVSLWSDEGISISHGEECVMTNCVLGYGLNIEDHALPSIIKGEKIGVYNNYFAHARFRPSIGGRCQFAKNVFYNYSDSDPNIIHDTEVEPATTTEVDITDCLYVGGPSTIKNTQSTFRSIRVSENGCSLYQTGNKVILFGDTQELNPVVRLNSGVTVVEPPSSHFTTPPLSLSAADVPSSVGCPNPDALDKRLRDDYANRTGSIIVDPSEVGWS